MNIIIKHSELQMPISGDILLIYKSLPMHAAISMNLFEAEEIGWQPHRLTGKPLRSSVLFLPALKWIFSVVGAPWCFYAKLPQRQVSFRFLVSWTLLVFIQLFPSYKQRNPLSRRSETRDGGLHRARPNTQCPVICAMSAFSVDTVVSVCALRLLCQVDGDFF